MLSHPIVYINGQRANTTSSNLTKGDRETDSNFFNVDFEANPTEELSTVKYQIYQPLDVISKMPVGDYTLAEFNTATDSGTYFQLIFNKPFSITADISAKVYKDGVFFAEFDHTKFYPDVLNLWIDTSANPITEAGTYDVVIGANNVYSSNQLAIEYWGGFEYEQWEFQIDSNIAYYNLDYYNSTKYNT